MKRKSDDSLISEGEKSDGIVSKLKRRKSLKSMRHFKLFYNNLLLYIIIIKYYIPIIMLT